MVFQNCRFHVLLKTRSPWCSTLPRTFPPLSLRSFFTKHSAVPCVDTFQQLSPLVLQRNGCSNLFLCRSLSVTSGFLASPFEKTTGSDQFDSNSSDSGEVFDVGFSGISKQTVLDSSSPVSEVFADYGLGGWGLPHNMIQSLLEILHTNVGISWLPTLMIATVSLRLLALPAYVKMRSFTARTNNHMPEQLKLQTRLRNATAFEKQKLAAEYMDFMRSKDINPLKALLYQLPTGLIFMSFFVGLRGMAQAKIPSLTTGGLWWFQDLTVSDPYFILPFLSCATMHLLVRYGAASAELGPSASIPGIQKFFMWMPFALMPFIMFQPSAMFVFWMTSNVFSFIQMRIFMMPQVQRYFGIPELVKHPKHVMEQMNPFEQMRKMKQERLAAERASSKVRDHMSKLERFAGEQKKGRT